MRASVVAVSLAASAVLAACTEPSPTVPSAPATPSPSRSGAAADRCARFPPPFEAGYLPDGFGRRLRRGAGLFRGTTDYPTQGLVGHYLGPRETVHVNFQVKGGPLPYTPANPAPIDVLGRRGRIGVFEGGWSVEFSLGRCEFRMDAYGISRPETVRVARDLRRALPAAERCSSEIPFRFTYLPQGFDADLVRGPASGAPPPRRNQVVMHVRSADGSAIEVRRPGTLFTELAQGDDAPTIDVLGGATSAFGPREPGGDDFLVWFQHPSDARADEPCSTYSLDEYGVSLAELRKVAEGLTRP